MKEDFELPTININKIKLYPEMDKNIASLLMIRNDDIVSLYSAKLIQRYQAAKCETCKYRNEDGNCENTRLADSFFNHTRSDSSDMLIYSKADNGSFYVGGKFGCVHHSEKEEKDGREEKECNKAE